MSRATYISRKRRNWETRQRQSKAYKRAEREAKRKLLAQPEISHEAAEQILRSQAAGPESGALALVAGQTPTHVRTTTTTQSSVLKRAFFASHLWQWTPACSPVRSWAAEEAATTALVVATRCGGVLGIFLRPPPFWQSLFSVWVSPVPAWFDSGCLFRRQLEACRRFQIFHVKVDLGSWEDSRPCLAASVSVSVSVSVIIIVM